MANDPNVFWGDVLLCALACIPVLLFVFRKRIDWKKRADVNDFDFGSRNDFSEPRFNINGLPMSGGIDSHGNPYGVTNTSMRRDW